MAKISIYMDLDGSKLGKKFEHADISKLQKLEHCDRKSYYGKANKVIERNYEALYSYFTLICIYDKKNKTLHVSKDYWNYSATTRRHQASFLDDIFNSDVASDVYQRLSLEG